MESSKITHNEAKGIFAEKLKELGIEISNTYGFNYGGLVSIRINPTDSWGCNPSYGKVNLLFNAIYGNTKKRIMKFYIRRGDYYKVKEKILELSEESKRYKEMEEKLKKNLEDGQKKILEQLSELSPVVGYAGYVEVRLGNIKLQVKCSSDDLIDVERESIHISKYSITKEQLISLMKKINDFDKFLEDLN